MSNYLSRLAARANPVGPGVPQFLVHITPALPMPISLSEESNPFEMTDGTFFDPPAETLPPEPTTQTLPNHVQSPVENEVVKADAFHAKPLSLADAEDPRFRASSQVVEIVQRIAERKEKISRQEPSNLLQAEGAPQATEAIVDYERTTRRPALDKSLPGEVDSEAYPPHSENTVGKMLPGRSYSIVRKTEKDRRPDKPLLGTVTLLPPETSFPEADRPLLEEPRLVIGKLTIEILPEESQSAPQQKLIRITNIVQPSSSRSGRASKLRFGLGQL
jgi:hypothetical protein